MPLFPLLYYILFGAALFGGGGALLQNMSPPTQKQGSDATVSAKPPAQPLAESKQASKEPAPPPAAKSPAAPAFDVVRVEKNGDGVIAGRAEPDWTVIVEADGKEIARSKVARDGEWAVVLEKPLPPGEYSIGLRALSPGEARGLASGQTVMVSVAGEKAKEKTVVALTEPGQPTRVLTPKEHEQPGTAAEEPGKPEQVETMAAAPNAAKPAKPREAPLETESKAASVEAPAKPSAPAKASRPEPASRGEPEVVVSFSAVDYEAGDNGKGKLFLSGEAGAGTRVKLYLDNNRVGEAVAAADGTWTFESLHTLPPEKKHTMRADAIQADGQVSSRAEVGFAPPPVSKPQIAAKEPEPAAGKSEARNSGAPEPKPEIAKAPPEESESVAAAKEPERAAKVEPKPAAKPRSEPAIQAAPRAQPEAKVAAKEPEPAVKPEERRTVLASAPEEKQPGKDAGERAPLQQKRSIVVRRGDTLWHIAKRRYGSGARYTAIYRDNRKQIRNPHWIYPGQEFSLPSN